MSEIIILLCVIDFMNIGNNIYGFDLVQFLDNTLPINTFAWFLILLFTGAIKLVNINTN